MSRSGRKRTCARVETNFPDHKRLKRIPAGTRCRRSPRHAGKRRVPAITSKRSHRCRVDLTR